jgi:hypothetical protein
MSTRPGQAVCPRVLLRWSKSIDRGPWLHQWGSCGSVPPEKRWRTCPILGREFIRNPVPRHPTSATRSATRTAPTSARPAATQPCAARRPNPAKARILFGEYVTTKWWPARKDQHPASEYGTRKKVEKRILPTFGDIPLGELDPSTIGAWKAAMVAEGLTARTVNAYLSLLGTILNAAVDDDLARSPLVRKSGAGRTAATRNQPVPRREVWLLREQLDRLVEAIDPRYRALVLVPRPGPGRAWPGTPRSGGPRGSAGGSCCTRPAGRRTTRGGRRPPRPAGP